MSIIKLGDAGTWPVGGGPYVEGLQADQNLVRKAVRARGLICTLRNLLSELNEDENAMIESGFATRFPLPADIADMVGEMEELEAVFDECFPLDQLPSEDPSTWSV